MRWVQRLNEETGKHEFIPRDEAAAKRGSTSAIHGDIVSFVSPVDGSVISDRKQLREHNKRNNVVNTDEFTPEFIAGKRKEREEFYSGRRSKQESLSNKQEIYESIERAERNGR